MRERLTKLPSGLLQYSYCIDRQSDICFCFNTLAEVGAPYQQKFRELIAERGYKVRYGVDIEKVPWVGDFAL